MKRPSQRIWDLIRKLYAGQNLWQTLTGREDSVVSAWDEIASAGEALVIPDLASFLLDERKDVREAAARTIGQLVANVPSSEFVRLEEEFRNSWEYTSDADSRWVHIKPKDLMAFWQLPNAAALMGVASCHRSGFIREAAVNELAKIADGSELPFLLLRLNDWVEAVRQSAVTAVMNRIRQDYAAHFLHHLRLAFRLRSCGRSQRGQQEQIVSAVTALLQEPDAALILQQGVLSTDRWLRRESFRMAIAAKSPQSTALLKNILQGADPIMRLWAARNVLHSLDDAELKPLLGVLVRDRFAPVRCEALNIVARRNLADARNTLANAVFDNHASVRSLARYWFQMQQPDFDFASVYRQSLGDSSAIRQWSAIRGLGETGAPSDAETVLRFLDAPVVSTRKAAIRALAELDGDRFGPQFIAALTSEHPGISNEAARALATRTSGHTEEFRSLFQNGLCPHVRKNLFKLLVHQPFWARGIFLFETLRDRDEHIMEFGRRALRAWLAQTRRMATTPSNTEIKQLREGVKASAGMLTPVELRELEFCLKSYK